MVNKMVTSTTRERAKAPIVAGWDGEGKKSPLSSQPADNIESATHTSTRSTVVKAILQLYVQHLQLHVDNR